MTASRHGYWRTGWWFVMAFICLVLLLRFGSDASSQTVTATPDSVDPVKRPPVVLRLTKADGSVDSELIKQVKSVKVGDKQAEFKPDAQGFTITPPELSVGTQPVQLLDSANKVIAQAQLRYQSESNGGDKGVASQSFQEVIRQREESRRDRLVGYNWYYILVTAMFLAVVGPFVLAIYRGTSAARGSDSRPLGLPVGSFRSILAYSLVAYLGFYVLTSILSVSQFMPPDFLLGIVATVIGFYFGSRSGEDGDASPKTGTVRGIVRHGTDPARAAMVRFKRSDNGTEPYSRISDLDGRFELRGAAPGKYAVTASITGSTPSDPQEISIAEGSDHEIEIVIKSGVPTPPPSAPTGTVQGTVTQPDATTPARQASVVLSQGGVEKGKGTTDASGKYTIDTVAIGEYDVEASLSPHQPSARAKVQVREGSQATVDLQLRTA